MPIDRNLCKLMTEELSQQFDKLEDQFFRVRDGLPQLWSRNEMKALLARMDKLKEQMERPRYYVGFLGRSQVGKSSTLNSILQAPQGEGPGTGGAGAPMTSNVTRLYRIDPAEGDGTGHRVTLRFMTPEQFKRRRDALCKFLGFPPDESDEAILLQIDELLRRETEGTDAAHPISEKTEDRRYLSRLLRSYKAFPHLVTTPPRVEKGSYSERKKYTNHPEGQEPWPYLLLAQVEIGFRTEAISPKLELIDLPGLGARLVADKLLTETFLEQLDGALVFQSSEQVAAKEAYDLLAELGGRFGGMGGRVWMIFTRFDSLTSDHHGGTDGAAVNILDNIAKTLSDNKVPPGQVLLVGNEFYKTLLDPDGVIHPPTAEQLKLKLSLDVDAEGRAIIPEGFKRHKELYDAFREVIKDGGIGKISEVIGELLAQKVESKVRDQVDRERREIRLTFSQLVETAREAARMDSGGFRRAQHWKVRLQEARHQLDSDRLLVETPTLEMMRSLLQELNELFPETLSMGERLRTEHKNFARILEDQASLLCKSLLVPAIFGAVSVRLRAVHATQGDVRLNGHPSPHLAWQDRADRDQRDLTWLAPTLSFQTPPLFPAEDGRKASLDDLQYRDAMLRKIEAVCYRASLAISWRAKGHLDELQDELTLLQGAERHVDAAVPALFQEILDALA